MQVVTNDQIHKPLSYQEYEYEAASLTNGLRVLLVSGKNLKEGGCALSVGSGSYESPKDFMGLAHFCEHMLFMGSGKYPEEDDFQTFVQHNGGYTNAYTDARQTVYFATIKSDALPGLLDRYYHIMIKPLLLDSAVDREVEAVNSEYLNWLREDLPQADHLMRILGNDKHPMCTFTIGNNATLRRPHVYGGDAHHAQSLIDLRKALIDFHDQYYSSNIMSLVVAGNQSLEELRSLVYDTFSKVPNKNLPQVFGSKYGSPHPPFRPEDLQYLVLLNPVKDDERRITFTFVVQDQYDLWEYKPSQFVTHVLGQKGPGSLTAVLKKEMLITNLFSYSADISYGATRINVVVVPTPQGLELTNIRRIATAIMIYIRLLKDSGLPRWYVDECKKLNEMRWRYSNMPRLMEFLPRTAQKMQMYPLEEMFRGRSLPIKDGYEMILPLLESMTVGKFNIYASARMYREQCTELDKFYGMHYKKSRIDASWISGWQEIIGMDREEFAKVLDESKLLFPRKNEFIPNSFELFPGAADPDAAPEKLKLDDYFAIWHKQDIQFGLPHVSVKARITIPYLRPTQEELQEYLTDNKDIDIQKIPSAPFKSLPWGLRNALIMIYVSTVMESLSETTNDAEIAGLDIEMDHTICKGQSGDAGISIHCDGFNDKAPSLFTQVLKRCIDFQVSDSEIELCLTKNKQALKNKIEFQQPHLRAVVCQTELLSPGSCPSIHVWLFLNQLDAQSVRRFLSPQGTFDNSIFSGARVEGVIIGNVIKDQAINEYFDTKLWQKLIIKDSTPEQRCTVAPIRLSQSNCQQLLKDAIKQPATGPTMLRCKVPPRPLPEPNYCVQLLWPSPNPVQSSRDKAIGHLLIHWLDQDFFNVLRTKETLGYVVYLRPVLVCNETYPGFTVQSTKPADYLISRIWAFIKDYVYDSEGRVNPKGFDEAKFNQVRDGLIALLEEKWKNLTSLCASYYQAVVLRNYSFDFKKERIEILKGMTLDEFKEELRLWMDMPWISVELEALQPADDPAVDSSIPKDVEVAYPERMCMLKGIKHLKELYGTGYVSPF